MPSQTRSAGLCIDVDNSQNLTWNSPSNVYALDGMIASLYAAPGAYTYSHYLKATSFGFSIPSNATILGVVAQFHRSGGSTFAGDVVRDYSVNLVVNNSITGLDRATSTPWNNSGTIRCDTYGSSLDSWGCALTPALVNATNFGVALAAFLTANANLYGCGASVDLMSLTVYYTINQSPNAPTNLSPNTNAFRNSTTSQNFTFTFSDPDTTDTMSAYRISYKKTTGSTYTQTSWVSATAANNATVTHVFAANTFDADASYQWYAEVKDSAGAASAASSNSTFNTLATPTCTITAPTGGGKKNAKSDLECTWTYSSPISSVQSKYQIQVQQGASVVYDTGEVSSASTSHTIPANALPYVGDPVCTTKVRVWDSAGHVSALTTLSDSFIAFQPYATVGTWISPVIEDGGRSTPVTITYDATTPTGTYLVLAVRKSTDNVTWGDWVDTASGAVIDNPHYIQIRATFTPSADLFNTPVLNSISIARPNQYYSSGSWLSPELNFSEMITASATLEHVETLNDGSVVYETRCKNTSDSAWTAWEAPFTTLDNIMQIRASITTASSLLVSPEITSIQATVNPTSKQSLWISQPIDVSQATNLSASKAIVESILHSGQILLYSRSKATAGGTWSDWSVVLYDGTLTHPANPYVQLFVHLIGEAEVMELTLSLDGDASVEVLKTGMTPGAEYSFATLNNMALIVNGDDLPLKWDAVSDPAVLGTDPPVLSMITTHHNKAWGVDTECSSRVRYSNILDPTKWDAYDFIDFNPDDGDQISSIIRYGQNLVVSKSRSMALLTGNKSSNYNVSWLDSETGATGKNAMCIADKYLVYVSQDGIRFTDLSQSVVSTERLLPSWEGINKRRLNQAACVYWKNKCYVALPLEGSLYNNTVWVYDFLRNCWSFIDGWCVSVWKVFNQYGEDILLSGSSLDGQLHVVDVTSYDDTIPVEFEWRSKDFNFRMPEKYKLFRNIFLDIEATSETTDLEVDLIVDGAKTGTYKTTIVGDFGAKTTRRILPPLYGAVLGAEIGLQIRGRCGIQGITVEYTVRGNIPGGDI